MISIDDFPEICRACLNKEGLETFEQPLLGLYNKITDLQVDVTEELPLKICYKCTRKLNEISMFIIESKNSDIHMRKLLQKSKSALPYSYEESHSSTCSDKLNSDEESTTGTTTTQYACGICHKHFNSKHELSVHHKTNETCKSNKISPDVIQLNLQSLPHTSEALHECEICLKKFRQPQNLKRHDNIVHKGLKPYKCEFCGKEFSRQLTKNEHIYSHKEEKPYSCSICSESFSTYTNHFAHLYLHKIESGKITNTTLEVKKTKTGQLEAKCTICQKIFSAPRALYQHNHDRRVSEQNFLCTSCGKAFKRKEQLQTHTRLHSGEKPFRCKLCGKQFRHASSFRSHNLLHTGEKPYCCKICAKSFSQSEHLKQHTRIHSGEKPFACAFCQKAFAQKCNLVVHERIHTGNMPYECSVCAKGFHHLSTMKKHEKIHRNAVKEKK